MASVVFRQRFMNALNNERATPPPAASEEEAPQLVDELLRQLKGDRDDFRSAAAARLEKLVVCDERAAERFVENGGIQALVAIINANPLKSAHPHAICVGQMAAAVALQHILMRLPHASEAIVQGGVLTGLVTMLDDGLPPMQRAATGLLATLANLQSGCKALCQSDGGLVLLLLLKTSKSVQARRTAAQCLLALMQHLSPAERLIVKSAYPLPHDVTRPKPLRRQLAEC